MIDRIVLSPSANGVAAAGQAGALGTVVFVTGVLVLGGLLIGPLLLCLLLLAPLVAPTKAADQCTRRRTYCRAFAGIAGDGPPDNADCRASGRPAEQAALLRLLLRRWC